MASFAVHPGAVTPYERLTAAELRRREPQVGLGATTSRYTRLARRAGRVLEYGAGRGTLTWELARQGARVTAVELSATLVDELLQRGRREPPSVARRVTAVQDDMRSFHTSRRFPLVIAPEGTLLHLYNRKDVEAFLANVRHHLTPWGRFACDVALPDPQLLTKDYDPISQIRYQDLGDGLVLAQRQFQPRELEMLLWYNGFRDVRVHLRLVGDGAQGGSARRSAPRGVLLVTARKGPRAEAASRQSGE